MMGAISVTDYFHIEQDMDGNYELCYVEDGQRLSTHATYDEAAYVRGKLRDLVDVDEVNQAWWESVTFYHDNIVRELCNDD